MKFSRRFNPWPWKKAVVRDPTPEEIKAMDEVLKKIEDDPDFMTSMRLPSDVKEKESDD